MDFLANINIDNLEHFLNIINNHQEKGLIKNITENHEQLNYILYNLSNILLDYINLTYCGLNLKYENNKNDFDFLNYYCLNCNSEELSFYNNNYYSYFLKDNNSLELLKLVIINNNKFIILEKNYKFIISKIIMNVSEFLANFCINKYEFFFKNKTIFNSNKKQTILNSNLENHYIYKKAENFIKLHDNLIFLEYKAFPFNYDTNNLINIHLYQMYNLYTAEYNIKLILNFFNNFKPYIYFKIPINYNNSCLIKDYNSISPYFKNDHSFMIDSLLDNITYDYVYISPSNKKDKISFDFLSIFNEKKQPGYIKNYDDLKVTFIKNNINTNSIFFNYKYKNNIYFNFYSSHNNNFKHYINFLDLDEFIEGYESPSKYITSLKTNSSLFCEFLHKPQRYKRKYIPYIVTITENEVDARFKYYPVMIERYGKDEILYSGELGENLFYTAHRLHNKFNLMEFSNKQSIINNYNFINYNLFYNISSGKNFVTNSNNISDNHFNKEMIEINKYLKNFYEFFYKDITKSYFIETYKSLNKRRQYDNILRYDDNFLNSNISRAFILFDNINNNYALEKKNKSFINNIRSSRSVILNFFLNATDHQHSKKNKNYKNVYNLITYDKIYYILLKERSYYHNYINYIQNYLNYPKILIYNYDNRINKTRKYFFTKKVLKKVYNDIETEANISFFLSGFKTKLSKSYLDLNMYFQNKIKKNLMYNSYKNNKFDNDITITKKKRKRKFYFNQNILLFRKMSDYLLLRQKNFIFKSKMSLLKKNRDIVNLAQIYKLKEQTFKNNINLYLNTSSKPLIINFKNTTFNHHNFQKEQVIYISQHFTNNFIQKNNNKFFDGLKNRLLFLDLLFNFNENKREFFNKYLMYAFMKNKLKNTFFLHIPFSYRTFNKNINGFSKKFIKLIDYKPFLIYQNKLYKYPKDFNNIITFENSKIKSESNYNLINNLKHLKYNENFNKLYNIFAYDVDRNIGDQEYNFWRGTTVIPVWLNLNFKRIIFNNNSNNLYANKIFNKNYIKKFKVIYDRKFFSNSIAITPNSQYFIEPIGYFNRITQSYQDDTYIKKTNISIFLNKYNKFQKMILDYYNDIYIISEKKYRFLDRKPDTFKRWSLNYFLKNKSNYYNNLIYFHQNNFLENSKYFKKILSESERSFSHYPLSGNYSILKSKRFSQKDFHRRNSYKYNIYHQKFIHNINYTLKFKSFNTYSLLDTVTINNKYSMSHILQPLYKNPELFYKLLYVKDPNGFLGEGKDVKEPLRNNLFRIFVEPFMDTHYMPKPRNKLKPTIILRDYRRIVPVGPRPVRIENIKMKYDLDEFYPLSKDIIPLHIFGRTSYDFPYLRNIEKHWYQVIGLNPIQFYKPLSDHTRKKLLYYSFFGYLLNNNLVIGPIDYRNLYLSIYKTEFDFFQDKSKDSMNYSIENTNSNFINLKNDYFWIILKKFKIAFNHYIRFHTFLYNFIEPLDSFEWYPLNRINSFFLFSFTIYIIDFILSLISYLESLIIITSNWFFFCGESLLRFQDWFNFPTKIDWSYLYEKYGISRSDLYGKNYFEIKIAKFYYIVFSYTFIILYFYIFKILFYPFMYTFFYKKYIFKNIYKIILNVNKILNIFKNPENTKFVKFRINNFYDYDDNMVKMEPLNNFLEINIINLKNKLNDLFFFNSFINDYANNKNIKYITSKNYTFAFSKQYITPVVNKITYDKFYKNLIFIPNTDYLYAEMKEEEMKEKFKKENKRKTVILKKKTKLYFPFILDKFSKARMYKLKIKVSLAVNNESYYPRLLKKKIFNKYHIRDFVKQFNPYIYRFIQTNSQLDMGLFESQGHFTKLFFIMNEIPRILYNLRKKKISKYIRLIYVNSFLKLYVFSPLAERENFVYIPKNDITDILKYHHNEFYLKYIGWWFPCIILLKGNLSQNLKLDSDFFTYKAAQSMNYFIKYFIHGFIFGDALGIPATDFIYGLWNSDGDDDVPSYEYKERNIFQYHNW